MPPAPRLPEKPLSLLCCRQGLRPRGTGLPAEVPLPPGGLTPLWALPRPTAWTAPAPGPISSGRRRCFSSCPIPCKGPVRGFPGGPPEKPACGMGALIPAQVCGARSPRQASCSVLRIMIACDVHSDLARSVRLLFPSFVQTGRANLESEVTCPRSHSSEGSRELRSPDDQCKAGTGTSGGAARPRGHGLWG